MTQGLFKACLSQCVVLKEWMCRCMTLSSCAALAVTSPARWHQQQGASAALDSVGMRAHQLSRGCASRIICQASLLLWVSEPPDAWCERSSPQGDLADLTCPRTWQLRWCSLERLLEIIHKFKMPQNAGLMLSRVPKIKVVWYMSSWLGLQLSFV